MSFIWEYSYDLQEKVLKEFVSVDLRLHDEVH